MATLVAWKPVYVGVQDYRWLEYVERCRLFSWAQWKYRAKLKTIGVKNE